MTRYTHGHQESVLRSHRWRTAENSCGYLLPHLERGMSLLDVGCGPGTITADLASRGLDVLGIDRAASVVDEARRDFPSVRFEVEDIFEIDGTWDVVHAHQVLQHVGDPVGALRRMATVANRLVAARDGDYPGFVWTGGDERLHRWLEVYLEVCHRNGANADAGRHLLRWAREAGLDDVTYTTSTWTFATPAERSWWGGLWAERTTTSAFAEQAVAEGIAAREELDDISAGWRTWASGDDAVFVVLHGEVVARLHA